LARARETLDAPTPNLAAAFGTIRQPRDPTIVAYAPRGKSTLSLGERPLSSRHRTALVKNVS
jgi:hypothetical protein